ncbi:MAG: hypothetical protein V5A30_03545 [Haloarculaceae archaeon]
MHLTPETVASERTRLQERGPRVVRLANDVRGDLGAVFDVDVDEVTERQYERTLDEVFADGALAVNVAAIAGTLRELDVTDDYPGFVVDELLGRELAAMLAGQQPLRLLAEATFHYADVRADSVAAGGDDLDAALAAGLQTRVPGWDWRETDPFGAGPE